MQLPEALDARAVVLVEGLSDRSAIETLAERRGRSLSAEGVAVVAIGGASNISRFLGRFGPHGLDLEIAGLYDAAEVGYFRRGLERAGLLPRYLQSRSELERSAASRAEMEALGFYRCVTDLEDELIRALTADAVVQIIEAEGDLGAFRTLQQQPAHLDRSAEQQLHRFLGTRPGRKIRYSQLLVEALDLDRIPGPLNGALAHVSNKPPHRHPKPR